VEIANGSALVGRTLAESGLRERAGVTVVAISRNGSMLANPAAQEVIRAGDRLAVVGTPGQVGTAETLFMAERDATAVNAAARSSPNEREH
jgi:K+/H+ antiporter YhaU regulatory subunit KhtT